jgi:virulence factor Mce-like protein
MITALALTTALLYISPPGQRMFTFFTDDAASVHLGDEVRIAGITVGEIKNVTLESDSVRVQAKIDNTAFVGDQSEIEVRMLTVVGGYYVNLVSLGDQPLGNDAIPRERVIMPYNLIRTLTDATKITDDVDPTPIKESLDEMQAGLQGTNVESLNAVIKAGNTLMSTIDRQRGQVTKILDLSDEYIERLSGFRETLKEMVRKVAIVEQTLILYSNGFGKSLDGLGDIVAAIGIPLTPFYAKHRDDFLEKIRNFVQKGRLWVDHNGLIVRILKRTQDHIMRILDIQDSAPELLATDLCIPAPGTAC